MSAVRQKVATIDRIPVKVVIPVLIQLVSGISILLASTPPLPRVIFQIILDVAMVLTLVHAFKPALKAQFLNKGSLIQTGIMLISIGILGAGLYFLNYIVETFMAILTLLSGIILLSRKSAYP